MNVKDIIIVFGNMSVFRKPSNKNNRLFTLSWRNTITYFPRKVISSLQHEVSFWRDYIQTGEAGN